MIKLINGKIFTACDEALYTEAMLVDGEKILWTGREADMPEAEGEIVDLGGKRVIPGLIDAHLHGSLLAAQSQQLCVMPPRIGSIRELEAEIERIRCAQQPGAWILGWGYDESSLEEKRSPNRWDLDRACADAPVMLMRTCAHIRCVNSYVLKLAGIDRNTPDPEGGEIERDENGEPTGVLKENANKLIAALIPKDSQEEMAEKMAALGRKMASQGIVGFCDMGNLGGDDDFELYEQAIQKGMRQKIGMYYIWNSMREQNHCSFHPEQLEPEHQLFIAGLKLIGDGSVSGRTAWMDQPYLGSENDHGIRVYTKQQLETAMEFCREHHCQLAVHAMGSRTIDQVLNQVCGQGLWEAKRRPCVRIEHVTAPSEKAVAQAAEHGIYFVTQPIFLYAESKSYLKHLGAERTKRTYPVAHLLEKKVPTAFSSDAPATFWAEPTDPFPGIKLAVTRTAFDGTDCGKEQAIDVETALKLYTRESARAAGFSGMGQIRAGYQADFVILDRDILEIPAQEFDQVKVMETWIRGAQVWKR